MKREAPEIMVARCLFASLLCAVFSAGAVMGAANAQTAGDPSAMVWCLDVERALVTRKQAWRCKGRVIDAKEAEQIKLRRIRRIRGRIKNPGPLFKGTRLSGSGTGFFVSPHGHVVTNHHVVDGCKGISFTPAGSGRLVGELLASDERKDLALLRVPLITEAYARFRDPDNVQKDEAVVVVGYPLHGKVAIRPVLVSGSVFEAKKNTRHGRFPMKIDVRRGNSGGPVLDQSGLVVGVVVAKVNTPHVFAATGKLVRDVGIAIRQPVTLGFLRRHRVHIKTERGGTPSAGVDLYNRAYAFVGQVGCWR
ncbi:MAG: trypsin-like peptidase domain-containing protein [Rhodospirillaceae bacterium]|jgi:S1-C subfamily serine protease|nr:trypsin-like peptidase domain-containing protein [Rhodospirillaceae bacterium]MBT5457987.1 trypsin-like peptidase domain-containing protein [Rhodospirillaceae bacterium]